MFEEKELKSPPWKVREMICCVITGCAQRTEVAMKITESNMSLIEALHEEELSPF